MKVNESELKAMRALGARPVTREGCLPADTIAQAARNELASSDRARVAEHLAACADCAEELELIRPLQAWAERTAGAYGHVTRPAAGGSWMWAWQLSSITLAVAVGAMLVWNLALRRDRTELMARVAAGPQPAIVVTAPPPSTIRGDVNVPILDLHSDALRSGGAPATIGSVSTDVGLVTLILNSDSRDTGARFGVDITDASGRVVWTSTSLKMTPFNTFTIALSPGALGAGVFRLQLFRIAGEQRTAIEQYSLRIESPR